MAMAAWFVLVFVFYAVKALDGAPCPDCGNSPVPFPLSTSASCGDQSYKLQCNSSTSTLTLPTLSGAYPVLSINPAAQRLVVNSSPITSSTSCTTRDLPSGGLVLNPSLPFNVTSSNTILLLNCSSNLLRSPLNCSSNNLCSQFLAQDDLGAPCRNKLCCTFTAGGSSTAYKIGVSEAACTAYVSVLGKDPSTTANKWNYGVELQWLAPLEPNCTSQKDCGARSTCQPVLTGLENSSRCLCDQGYFWNSTSGFCTDVDLLCPHCGDRRKAPLIAGTTLGALALIAAACIGWLLLKRRRIAKQARDDLSKGRQEILSAGNTGGRSAKLYTSGEMKRATHGFARERLLGSGGFGDVYKGVLDDGTMVAVKSAKVGNTKGVEQVLNEVRILSQVNHKSLVKLLGCCVETKEPLLVYEYIDNGTLLDHLKQQQQEGGERPLLEWRRRVRVALQTAEGLAYLHSAANPPIYHRDVKSSNILLDRSLNAKVSDFGLSRLAEEDLSHISTCAQGTLGYLDPEYYRNYQLTAKSDVYSFGVVLLELVTSQRVIEFARGQDYVNLAVYVATKVQEEEAPLLEVVDPRLLATSPPPTLDSISAVTWLALSCLRDSRSDRPSMTAVVEGLQHALAVLGPADDAPFGAAPPRGHAGFAQSPGPRFVQSPGPPFHVDEGGFDESLSSTTSEPRHVFPR